MATTTTIERPLTVTPYLRLVDGKLARPNRENPDWTFASVEELWDALVCWRANGVWVRLGFYAARELIYAGAFEYTWDELREDALRHLEERVAGTGCGISSSDVNHTIVGSVTQYDLVDRELASCR
jgi:hypothetical protein